MIFQRITCKMISFPSFLIILCALVAPYTISAHRYDSSSAVQPETVYTTLIQQTTPATVSSSSAPSTGPTATSASTSSQAPSQVSSTAPTSSSSLVSQAPSQVSSAAPVSSSSPATTNSTCSGAGMTISWTGDEVPYSWSGGSGTTTGCTTLGSSFAGQVEVGGSGGTIFEGNYNGGEMYFDVSFITGFSVPMVCSSSAGMSGCSIDLFSQGTECPQKSGSVCTNPVGINGNKQPGSYGGDMGASPWCYACSAPDPFFQPCAGAGYTFPYDDTATQSASGTISCCIGTSCGSTGREGSTKDGHAETTRSSEPCQLCSSGGSKRGFDATNERNGPALSPSLQPRMHKRSLHKHGLAYGHKGI